MPRTGKNGGRGRPAGGESLGGYGAQAQQAPTGGAYGSRKASLESQSQVPIAQAPGLAPTPPAPAAGGSGAGGVPRDRAERDAMAMAAAKRLAPPQPLTGPTQRPSEPFTAGMPLGAGSGPEVLRNGDRVARTYRMLADTTGNPMFDELAQAALALGR